MNWTTTITQIIKMGAGMFQVIVTFNNGTDSIDVPFTITGSNDINWLQLQVRNYIAQLNATYSTMASLSVGMALLPASPDAAPTAAQLAQQQFVFDYQRWLQVKKAIDAGILTGNETPVVNLKNKVVSEFLPSYLPLL